MKPEKKVALLAIATLTAIALFSYYLGVVSIFRDDYRLHLLYNFAGGIESGSTVRLMGVKVGKVTNVDFVPEMKDALGQEAKLQITISVARKAWSSIRADSRFFINMAGVIGEKYIEITPGSLDQDLLQNKGFYRGQDPPRIDQLLSQSFGLADKILQFVEDNEEKAINILSSLESLMVQINHAVTILDNASRRGQLETIINNLAQISGDLAHVSHRLRSNESDKTIDLLYDLLWRLEELDKKAIRDFLQKEGIKAKIF